MLGQFAHLNFARRQDYPYRRRPCLNRLKEVAYVTRAAARAAFHGKKQT